MLVGLVAVAAVPAAILATRFSRYTAIDAWVAVPVAAVLALLALSLARRARFRTQVTAGRVGGEGAARLGRALAVLGLCIVVTAGIALGFYGILTLVSG